MLVKAFSAPTSALLDFHESRTQASVLILTLLTYRAGKMQLRTRNARLKAIVGDPTPRRPRVYVEREVRSVQLPLHFSLSILNVAETDRFAVQPVHICT